MKGLIKKITAAVLIMFALTGRAQISDALLQDTIDLWIVPNMAKSITAAKVNTLLTWLNTNKLHQDSIITISIVADTCIEIDEGGVKDTICFSTGGVNYWTPDGDDIENNNAGKVILPGDSTFFDAIPDEATKVGRILHVNQYGEIEWTSPLIVNDAIEDTLRSVPKLKNPIITFTFDDGDTFNLVTMLPIFQDFNAVACAAIVSVRVGTGRYMTYPQIESLENEGWEILSHTVNHPSLKEISYDSVLYELSASRDTLRSRGFTVNNLAYPNNHFNDSVLIAARKYYRSARAGAVQDQINPYPLRTYALSSYTIQLFSDTATYKSLIDECASTGQWLIFYCHSWETDSAVIRWTLDYITDNYPEVQIKTVNQALDLIRNSIDTDDGFAVWNEDIRLDGVVYRRTDSYFPYNYQAAPFIHTTRDTNTTGRNTFVGQYSGNLTLSAAGGASTLASLNSGFGYYALQGLTTGYDNAAFGYAALNTNSTGYSNTGVGKYALYNNAAGYSNTALGNSAGYSNASGYQNVFIGDGSGNFQTGNNNVWIGRRSGYGTSGASTSSGNLGMGYNTMYAHKTGNYNVAIGQESMRYDETGMENVANGYRSLYKNVSGRTNVALGFESLYSNTSGGYSVGIGAKSGYLNQTGNYNISIGYHAGYNNTGSYKFYLACDSTSSGFGTRTNSKLLMYADQSNADKSAHTLNIFAKTAIGSATAADSALTVTGGGRFTGGLKAAESLTVTGLDSASTSYGLYYNKTTGVITYDSAGSGGVADSYWDEANDTLTADYHVRVDSSFFMSYDSVYIGYHNYPAAPETGLMDGFRAGINFADSSAFFASGYGPGDNLYTNYMYSGYESFNELGSLSAFVSTNYDADDNKTSVLITSGDGGSNTSEIIVTPDSVRAASDIINLAGNGAAIQIGTFTSFAMDSTFALYTGDANGGGGFIVSNVSDGFPVLELSILQDFNNAYIKIHPDTIKNGADVLLFSDVYLDDKMKIEDDTVRIYKKLIVDGDLEVSGTITGEADPVWISDSATYISKSQARSDINDSLVANSQGFLTALPASALEWSDTTASAGIGIATFDDIRDTAAAIRADFPTGGWVGTATSDLDMDGYNLDACDSATVEDLISNNHILTTSLADHGSSGFKISLTAAANVAIGDVCYVNSSSKMALVDADAIATSSGLFMAAESISGDAAGMFIIGPAVVRDDTWNWTPGGLIYITVTGTTGNTLSQTAPSGTNDVVQIVGVAIDDDTILFNPQLVQIELN